MNGLIIGIDGKERNAVFYPACTFGYTFAFEGDGGKDFIVYEVGKGDFVFLIGDRRRECFMDPGSYMSAEGIILHDKEEQTDFTKRHKIYGEIITQHGMVFPAVWYPELMNNEPDNFKAAKEDYAVIVEQHDEDPHFTIQELHGGFIFRYDGASKAVSVEPRTGLRHIFKSL